MVRSAGECLNSLSPIGAEHSTTPAFVSCQKQAVRLPLETSCSPSVLKVTAICGSPAGTVAAVHLCQIALLTV